MDGGFFHLPLPPQRDAVVREDQPGEERTALGVVAPVRVGPERRLVGVRGDALVRQEAERNDRCSQRHGAEPAPAPAPDLGPQKLLFDAAAKAGEAGEPALSIQLYARLISRYPNSALAALARTAVAAQKARLAKPPS